MIALLMIAHNCGPLSGGIDGPLRSWLVFQVDFRCPNLIASCLPTSLGRWLLGLPLSHCSPLEAMKYPLLC